MVAMIVIFCRECGANREDRPFEELLGWLDDHLVNHPVTSMELTSMFPDITYRMVDYWSRVDALPVDVAADGSGSHRTHPRAAVAMCARRQRAIDFLEVRRRERTFSAGVLDKVADLLEQVDLLHADRLVAAR